MSNKDENLIPDDYWNTMTDDEKDGMLKAMADSDELLNEVQWEELDEAYYDRLRERFEKGVDEIGPRVFKSYKYCSWFLRGIFPPWRDYESFK